MFSKKCLFSSNPIRNLIPDGGAISIFRKVGFIGDSLSSGEHESFSVKDNAKGFHDFYEYSWGQYIARKAGLTAINFSRGGLKAREFLDFSTGEDPRANNIFAPENKCQAYFIALGLNDMTHIDDYKDGFGSYDDVDFVNEDNCKDSYVAQYVKIILKLRKIEPKCRIFVLTTAKEKPEDKKKKEDFDRIQKFLNTLPEKFEYIYVIDLRKYAPTYDKKWGEKYFLGGHMSALGYKITADMVMTYVDYIIHHNIEDFRQVGFIGRDNDLHNELNKW